MTHGTQYTLARTDPFATKESKGKEKERKGRKEEREKRNEKNHF